MLIKVAKKTHLEKRRQETPPDRKRVLNWSLVRKGAFPLLYVAIFLLLLLASRSADNRVRMSLGSCPSFLPEIYLPALEHFGPESARDDSTVLLPFFVKGSPPPSAASFFAEIGRIPPMQGSGHGKFSGDFTK